MGEVPLGESRSYDDTLVALLAARDSPADEVSDPARGIDEPVEDTDPLWSRGTEGFRSAERWPDVRRWNRSLPLPTLFHVMTLSGSRGGDEARRFWPIFDSGE
jgi:hypothetical protein